VPQAYPPPDFQSQFDQSPLETIPQAYHDPVNFADQFQPSKYLPAVPPPSKLFEFH
jgi:hypothetical protein